MQDILFDEGEKVDPEDRQGIEKLKKIFWGLAIVVALLFFLLALFQ